MLFLSEVFLQITLFYLMPEEEKWWHSLSNTAFAKSSSQRCSLNQASTYRRFTQNSIAFLQESLARWSIHFPSAHVGNYLLKGYWLIWGFFWLLVVFLSLISLGHFFFICSFGQLVYQCSSVHQSAFSIFWHLFLLHDTKSSKWKICFHSWWISIYWISGAL